MSSIQQETAQNQRQPKSWRDIFRFRARTDDKAGLIRDLITNDANLPLKTRIPEVFTMSYLDCVGAWASANDELEFLENGKTVRVRKDLEGLDRMFRANYRINAVSREGLGREEYSLTARSYLAGAEISRLDQMEQEKIGEGVRKKKEGKQ